MQSSKADIQGRPCKAGDTHRYYRIKYFTNGRLRIDFFQPRCRLGGNNGIMGYFGKSLTISRLRFSRFSVGADELI